MSALINIWTSKMAKLRQKDESSSARTNSESKLESLESPMTLARFLQFKSDSSVYSEAVISLVMESICP
ncbi:hypothetical protein ACHQM5_023346 [Ranunculus cassubicifolius]